MCVIVYSPKGERIPESVFSPCWTTNPDGGGVMWAASGEVKISKGFMSKEKMQKALHYTPKGAPFVAHFRIGTSGGNIPSMTHPWRIHDDLGMAHNGVISGLGCKKKSDTAKLHHTMKKFPSSAYREGPLVKLIDQMLQGSRLILLHGNGACDMLGEGWSEIDGLWFSNTNWKWRTSYTYSYGSDDYYDTGTSWNAKRGSAAKESRHRVCDDCGGGLVAWGSDVFCEDCGRSLPAWRV